MAKKVSKIIKLQIPAGKANPAPPIGPALGAAGGIACCLVDGGTRIPDAAHCARRRGAREEGQQPGPHQRPGMKSGVGSTQTKKFGHYIHFAGNVLLWGKSSIRIEIHF